MPLLAQSKQQSPGFYSTGVKMGQGECGYCTPILCVNIPLLVDKRILPGYELTRIRRRTINQSNAYTMRMLITRTCTILHSFYIIRSQSYLHKSTSSYSKYFVTKCHSSCSLATDDNIVEIIERVAMVKGSIDQIVVVGD